VLFTKQKRMTVKYDVSERIGTITLNRPEKRNALNEDMVDELSIIFSEAAKDEQVKVIVLQSEGSIFCSGADLASLEKMQNNSYDANLEDSLRLKNLFLSIYSCNKPIIGKMKGHALAGGAGLATLCDFVFATPESKIGYTEVRIGFVPAIVMVFLIRKIGEGKSREMLLGGELLTAEVAKEYGLINWISETEKIDGDVEDFAKKLVLNNSGTSMAITKETIRKVQSMDLEDALNFAAKTNAKARSTEDCLKGIQAFLNKQKIEW